jgi:hypothetical protein
MQHTETVAVAPRGKQPREIEGDGELCQSERVLSFNSRSRELNKAAFASTDHSIPNMGNRASMDQHASYNPSRTP